MENKQKEKSALVFTKWEKIVKKQYQTNSKNNYMELNCIRCLECCYFEMDMIRVILTQ